MKKESGFTLIELMCAVGVLGLITAVSIPNMVAWRADRQLDGAVREMLSVVQASRLRAVKENAQVVIDFDLASDSYTSFVDNGAGGGTAGNWTRDGDETVLKNVKVDKGINLLSTTFDGGSLAFDSRGTPVLNGGMFAVSEEVHLKNGIDAAKGIRISMAGNPTIIRVTPGRDYY